MAGGLFGKAFDRLRDRFDGNEEQEERRDQPAVGGFVPGVGAVEADAPSIPGVGSVAAEAPGHAAAPSMIPGVGPVGVRDTGDDGRVFGSGLTREYVTREGDTLEAIGAYFYGDLIHAQRLRDDNPTLARHSGPLPGGVRLRVSEDAARGDSVSG
ncbi:MAG: hypothetical protein U0531_11830 [Dehalococcoidia bacterium]